MIIKIFLSLLSIIFSLVMIYITQINYKNKILGKLNYLVWIGIWVMIILVSIRPEIVDVYFEENYKIDIFYILSVISILFLLILNYFLFLKLNILEKINTLIRSKSLKDIFERIK